MKTISLYTDYRHNNDMLAKRLKDAAADHARVIRCDADDLMDEGVLAKTDLLVMPGGADLFYCEKLDGRANNAIQGFIKDGGHYLGICAGAYYGAQALSWAADSPSHCIQGARELALVKATAVGPVKDFIQGGMEESWDGVCPLYHRNGTEMKAVYRGGCRFEDFDDSGFQVLASYDRAGSDPAVLKGAYGKGEVILSGPHIELRGIDYARLLYRNANPSYDYEAAIIQDMAPHDNQINAFWQETVLGLLGLSK